MRRQFMRSRNAMPGKTWRRRKPKDELPDLEGPYGGVLAGPDRCLAVGLERGDCTNPWPVGPSGYCYYHDKLFTGLTEPSAEVYPVWPLPVGGYVITEPHEAVA